MKQVNVYLKKDRETKNTFRFEEVNNTGTDTPVIGTMYIPKATLKDLDWSGDTVLQVTITTGD